MPYKNKVKNLQSGKVFHAYNRAINKIEIFIKHSDYFQFIEYLRDYLDPEYESHLSQKVFDFSTNKYIDRHKLTNDVEIIAYCLMPNHFHLLLRCIEKRGMSKLIARISSRYTRYFNLCYHREGRLWADTYKAVEIKNEEQFRTVIKYIHENPSELGVNILEYKYSSLKYYLGGQSNKLLKKGRTRWNPR